MRSRRSLAVACSSGVRKVPVTRSTRRQAADTGRSRPPPACARQSASDRSAGRRFALRGVLRRRGGERLRAGRRDWREAVAERVDDHSSARVTGTPVLYESRLYVPVSSVEEGFAGKATYNAADFAAASWPSTPQRAR